ncbi:hypothetical protein [Rummeliibacillus sp. SL167]|uniref:hypothetical protein n=1 Tax=Rummeliibacillus sp. SL167 TaxID=2579792 RepID=UPI0011B76314|nr:hypothetical protein [Rummeliibacillus sp. SL167]
MIGQVGRTQLSLLGSVQPKGNQPVQTLETTNETDAIDVETIDSDSIVYDKYGNTEVFGINVGNSLLANQFSEEDVKRWNQINQEQGPLKNIWEEIVGTGNTGYSTGYSMSFFDFCYLAEKGKMVNPQNALSSDEAQQQIQSKNWFTFFKNTTVNGKGIDVQDAMQHLDILQRCYEIGLINNHGGLMSSDELLATINKQKYDEQRAFLEKQYAKDLETKELEVNSLEKAKQVYNDSI